MMEQGEQQQAGQSSAAEDTLGQEQRQAGDSTSAQRSGGQEPGGAGSDDASFAGSSFASQSGDAGGGAEPAVGSDDQPDTRAEYVRADDGEESPLDGQ